ncbi:ThrRS/AlaRS common domain-containing protein [Plenodomus tracheiphilus IPT5]|uniref:ThrRS/AlaRS common domain-containing protein n=1 Tax=Plenodomus tracheiphilus IPT5 TaxID=1408161 RepID=A0A6A7AM94_9PLEO|nr:ThrRS/AlaRS common domain-containing protein [Plenodomus tracheiphilus IPT5]
MPVRYCKNAAARCSLLACRRLTSAAVQPHILLSRARLLSRTSFLFLTFHTRYPRCNSFTMTMPKTVALFQQDETLRKHTTKIISVQPVTALSEANRPLFKTADECKDFVVVTAETIFYAQGGGQPCDTGKMTLTSSSDSSHCTFDVTSVRNGTDGQILHLGSFSPSSSSPFQPGASVEQAIDSEKRFLNSRIHTGGHVVGLAVRHLSSSIPDVTELKAQHYPDLAFVDFKGLIDGKHKEAVQAQVDAYISQALPVKVYFWNEAELREKCAVVPEAVAIPEGELVRAVDIVGAGAYPCGGTHVADTGMVGKVTIKKISRSKGNSKVSYVVS